MNTNFVEYLTLRGFNRVTAQEFVDACEIIELASGSVMAHQGSVVDCGYFLLEGLCHACYFTDGGKVFSKEFYWQNDWMINFESLISDVPTPYTIETLEASRLVKIPLSQLKTWRANNHAIYLHQLEIKLLHKEYKERFMLLNSPEARYKIFREMYPELEVRLADYQVAAYIGVTPVSLSRIKKRVLS